MVPHKRIYTGLSISDIAIIIFIASVQSAGDKTIIFGILLIKAISLIANNAVPDQPDVKPAAEPIALTFKFIFPIKCLI